MYELDARAFVAATNMMAELNATIREHSKGDKSITEEPVLEGNRKDLAEELEKLSALLYVLQAEMTQRSVIRLCTKLIHVSHSTITYGEVANALANIAERLQDELSSRLVVVIETKYAEHYRAKSPALGQLVFDKFENSRRDIDEAAKCLALRRNKAMVFHLMLAMEGALRSLAGKIGAEVYDAKRDQFHPWAVIVGNVKDAIPALPKAQQDEWTQAHNLLWGVNKSWRNGTMHPAETYNDEEAETIFEAVKGFMRYLAPLV